MKKKPVSSEAVAVTQAPWLNVSFDRVFNWGCGAALAVLILGLASSLSHDRGVEAGKAEMLKMSVESPYQFNDLQRSIPPTIETLTRDVKRLSSKAERDEARLEYLEKRKPWR
jgi:hypothetical protein